MLHGLGKASLADARLADKRLVLLEDFLNVKRLALHVQGVSGIGQGYGIGAFHLRRLHLEGVGVEGGTKQ